LEKHEKDLGPEQKKPRHWGGGKRQKRARTLDQGPGQWVKVGIGKGPARKKVKKKGFTLAPRRNWRGMRQTRGTPWDKKRPNPRTT